MQVRMLLPTAASVLCLIHCSLAWTETPWSGNTWTADTWTESFLTRPGQSTVRLNVITNSDRSLLADGYIFISPYRSFRSPKHEGQRRFGPTIFDQDGSLIWAGNHTTDQRGWGPGPCDYNGQIANHLCYADGVFQEQGGHTAGNLKFYDNTYREVARLTKVGGLRDPDSHEINSINNGTSVINDVYEFRKRDLREWGGKNPGYLLDGCFQDRKLDGSGELLFQLCLSEIIPLGETAVWPPGKPKKYNWGAGDTSANQPWDLFHINAIDQDVEGNYYVSSRNMKSIYKISGRNHPTPKKIIWKLGGHDNHFKYPKEVEFSWQHHVRVFEVGPEETIISVFDNAWDGIASPVTARASSGKVIAINNVTMTARLLERYWHPENLHTGFAGSNQIRLSNGNAFLGWGVRGELSEHEKGIGGKTLWYAKYGVGKDLESYRCWKRLWKGYPADPPDVFAYSSACDADVMVYMSWNGATEYKGWQVYITDSSDASSGGTPVGGVWARMGYETMADIGKFPPGAFTKYVYVEALGPDNEVLGRSRPRAIYVPTQDATEKFRCNTTRCNIYMKYDRRDTQAHLC